MVLLVLRFRLIEWMKHMITIGFLPSLLTDRRQLLRGAIVNRTKYC